MVRTIFKYPCYSTTGSFTLDLPIGAQLLCVQLQNNRPMVWALVDPEALKEPVEFTIFGTGHPISDEFLLHNDYVVSFQHGIFVWHLFKEKKLSQLKQVTNG